MAGREVVDGVNTGDGVEAGVRKWQRPGSIYSLKLGALGQAALGGKRIRGRDRLFMDVNADDRTAGGSGDPQGRASCATSDIEQALPGGKVEPLQKPVLLV